MQLHSPSTFNCFCFHYYFQQFKKVYVVFSETISILKRTPLFANHAHVDLPHSIRCIYIIFTFSSVVYCKLVETYVSSNYYLTADTRRWINVGLTLVHRLRRWTLCPCLTEIESVDIQILYFNFPCFQRWSFWTHVVKSSIAAWRCTTPGRQRTRSVV